MIPPAGLRLRGSSLLASLLCALLGFAVAVQVSANQEAGLTNLRQSDLVRILDDVSERTGRLEAEARELESTRAKLGAGAGSDAVALEETQARLDTLGILAGTAPAVGPGVEVDIADPKHEVPAEVLLDTVQELRDAGAEALQIGPVRVTASTWLVDADTGITVDATPVAPPYRLRVIGDPATLRSALDIPGGVLEVLRQEYGVRAEVRLLDRVVVDALRTPKAPEYARPAPEATGGSSR